MLYIIRSDYFMCPYILEPLQSMEGIRFIMFERDRLPFLTKIKRFLRAFIIRKKGLWTNLFYNERIIREISEIKPDDKVLFFSIENLKELLILDKEIPAKKRSVYIWNPVATINRNLFSRAEYFVFMHLLNMNILTFDKDDARKYRFSFANQVYKYPAKSLHQKEVVANSVFFIGQDKYRSRRLAKLAIMLTSAGAQPVFYILKGKHTVEEPTLKVFYHDVGMNYANVLEYIQRSSCLLEIVQKGQSGITLRTLEALFCQKKLITNNKAVKDYDFYHPNNVFIYTDETDTNDVKAFLLSPYVPISKEITDNYEIETWIKQFV